MTVSYFKDQEPEPVVIRCTGSEFRALMGETEQVRSRTLPALNHLWTAMQSVARLTGG